MNFIIHSLCTFLARKVNGEELKSKDIDVILNQQLEEYRPLSATKAEIKLFV